MKNIVKGFLILFYLGVSCSVVGQVPMPGLPNIFGGQQQQQQAPVIAPVAPEDQEPKIKQDLDKLKAKQDLELDNKLMSLEKEKILLEQELSELYKTGDTTIQDSLNLAIKKKNLELLYLKEQVLLKSELEKYGYEDKNLPPPSIFGQEYFRNPRLRMINTPKDITPSESYILGSGDQIQVDVWGKAGYNANYTVDETGFVTIPKKQRVFVKGKSLGQVRSLLRSRFSQLVNLSGSNFNVSVSNTRTITVHVTGEVFYPGTYTLQALNSAFNILTVAGGPTNIGSMRNVIVQRGGKTIDTFDLYQYLFGSAGNEEVFLQNNDYLIVPSISKTVQVSGGVRRQAKYELKQNEGFKELLTYAGDFSTDGYRKDIVVQRIVDHSYYNTFSFNWDSISKINKNFSLADGDKVNVKFLNQAEIYLARIKGGVKAPGVYKVKEGEKLSDIINRAGGLQREAYLDKAYLIRTNIDLTKSYFVFKPSQLSSAEANMLLEDNDEIIIFTKQEFVEVAFLSTEDFVRNPLKIEYIQGLKASDLIKMSGGVTDDAYKARIFVERINADFSKALLPIELSEDGSVITDVILMRNDVIRVYVNPIKNENYMVKVFGEVNTPGGFSYRQNMTLKDVLVIAGGMKATAEYTKIEVASVVRQDQETGKIIPLEKMRITSYSMSNDFDKDEVSKTIKINPMDQVFVRKAFFNEQDVIVLEGEVKYPGSYAIAGKDETLLDVVERAGGFTNFAFLEGAEFRRTYKDTQNGRVIVDLKKAQNRPSSRFNYYLANNDTLIVPRMDQTVRVTGSIENNSEGFISSYYKKGKRAKFYVNNYAGGFDQFASRKAVYVKYANGQNVRTKNFILFKVFPKVKTGSIVYVPSKENDKGKKFSLDATLTRVLTTTTTVLTLFALINLATGG